MKKKDSNIVILGVIAVIAIVILVLLFKQAMTGGYAYTDKLQVVPALNMPPTPMISPNIATYDDRYAKRQIYWEESNRAYNIPGELISVQDVPVQKYPVIYEQPAFVQYDLVESPKGKSYRLG
ncbi:hypothetical protein KY338_07020 [Candidatus Woesearchaeota archaeon]|nr:hypothetical protein [Candidatus Woesearchaeota archaeon]MBW3005389.1 hypothetical protein [Candidatus Woesearchaeota archaeon]